MKRRDVLAIVRSRVHNPVRQIGRFGTGARVVGGSAAIALPMILAWHQLAGRGVAFFALPVLAILAGRAVTLLFEQYAPRSLESTHAICSYPSCLRGGSCGSRRDCVTRPPHRDG
jgi:hypothetical protein